MSGDVAPLGGHVSTASTLRPPRPRNLNRRISAVLVVLIVLGGYLLYAVESSSNSILPPAPDQSTGPSFPTPIRHVIVLMMEDQAVADVLKYGPYERYLADNYAFTSQYYGLTSDSLKNYEYAISGTATASPVLNATNNSVFAVSLPQSKALPIPSILDTAGLTWTSYTESMPSPCDLQTVLNNTTHAYSPYDVYHNPFIHYGYVTTNSTYCAAHVLPLTSWSSDLAAGNLPNYVWVTPNDTNDDHGCSSGGAFPGAPTCIPHGDAWLRNFLGPFINSSFFSNSVVFLTYDFDDSSAPNTTALVYLAAISPYAHLDYVSGVISNPFNLLTTTEWLLGLPSGKLHYDAWKQNQNPPMLDLFDFGTTYSVGGTVRSTSGVASGVEVAGSGYRVSTNATGVFDLPMPNGTYTFTAGLGACQGAPETFRVTGAPVTVDLKVSC